MSITIYSKKLAGILFISSLLILNLFSSSFSQSKNNPDREKKLKTYLDRATAYGFSGQVLVAENGKILLDQGFGYANKERQLPNTRNTVFNVASLTKQFTAAAILRLETNGKLKTSDTIDKYFDNIPADKAKITIHQLLTHTAGFPHGPGGEQNTTREDTVAKIFKQSLAAKPGERFIYSNNGYQVLSAIIERVSGQSFAAYLTEKLFKPAGMSQSGFYQDDRWTNYPIAKTFNEWTKLKAFNEWNKGWNYGNGAAVSTVDDLYKWFSALNAGKILPPEEREKLFQKYAVADDKDASYGYGWYIKKLAGGKNLIYHGGDNPGYHSEFRWYPDDKRLIIVLANYEVLEPDGVAIQKRVIAGNLSRILNGDDYKQPPLFIKQRSKEMKKSEGLYALPGGAKFKIWNDGGQLKIAAEGQEAINALTGYDSNLEQKYTVADDLTEFIVKNIVAGKNEEIKSRLSAEDYENYIPFLAKEFKEFKNKLGEFKDFTVQGTTSFPWDPANYRTNVLLKFEKGATDFYLGWGDGKPNDFTTETGRPFPLIVPLVAQSKTEFSTFEFLNSKLSNITFKEINGKIQLQIKTGDKNLTASKVTGKSVPPTGRLKFSVGQRQP